VKVDGPEVSHIFDQNLPETARILNYYSSINPSMMIDDRNNQRHHLLFGYGGHIIEDFSHEIFLSISLPPKPTQTWDLLTYLSGSR